MAAVLPYNSQAPGSEVNTGMYADPTGDHWAGTLRGNTDKPPVGCTGVEQVVGCPQNGAVAAVNGCAGNQWLNPKLQKGGNGYSAKDTLLSKVTGPYAGYAPISTYQNLGENSDLSHGSYKQENYMTGGKYRKGSLSKSRPGHKDFMTYKQSKYYNEKKLQKLIGRKTIRAPVFPYVGLGGRRLSKKQMKKYLNKRKQKAGSCGCGGSITPYSGGGEPEVGPTYGIPPMPRKIDIENRFDVKPFNIQPADEPMGEAELRPDGFIFTNQTGGKYRKYKTHKKRKNSKKSRKHYRKQKGGRYCQYLGNQPFSMGYSLGGINLSPSQSALANPTPQSPYPICSSKFPGQP
jgi:hypothetical protein